MNEALIEEIETHHELLIRNLKSMDGGKACDMVLEGLDYLSAESPDDRILKLVKESYELWLLTEDEKYEYEMLDIIHDANNEKKETKTYVLTNGMLKWDDANDLICNISQGNDIVITSADGKFVASLKLNAKKRWDMMAHTGFGVVDVSVEYDNISFCGYELQLGVFRIKCYEGED